MIGAPGKLQKIPNQPATNGASEQNAQSLAGLHDVTIHGSPDHRRVIKTDDHDFLAKVAAKKSCDRLSC
jgi:hypothetical protein